MRAGRDCNLRRKKTQGLDAEVAEDAEELKSRNKNMSSSASSVSSVTNPQVSIPIRDSNRGATFNVRVQPRAKRNAVIGQMGDALKIALTAPPVEGKANDACIAFLADLLDVPRSSITIAAGQTGRNKAIRVAGLGASEVSARLAKVVARSS